MGGPALVNGSVTSFSGTTGTYFEALRTTNDRTPIPVLTPQTRGWMERLGRERLAAIGRYLYDNVGVVSYAVDTLLNYSAPLTPQAATGDYQWDAAAEAYFRRWSQVAEFTGRWDFDEFQVMALKSATTDGDVGALMTADNGFPQLQAIEGWRIRNLKPTDSNRDGVEVDKKGRILGLWIEELPGGIATFVPATEMILIGDLDRVSAYRGFTPLRRGMNDVRDVGDLKSLEKLAQKVRSSLPAVLEGDTPIEENVWGDDTANDSLAGTTQQDKKLTLAELLGGDIPDLPNGKTLKVLTEVRNPQPVTEFMTALVGHFVYGLGLPPAFFLDEKLTGPNVRAVNGKAQRVFERKKKALKKFVLWTWRRVIGEAIARGELKPNPKWDCITFQGPAEISIDTGEDNKSDLDALAVGIRSRQRIHGKGGGDWVTETDQIFREQKYILSRAKELATEQGVPIELVLRSWGMESPNNGAKPAMQDDGDGADPENQADQETE